MKNLRKNTLTKVLHTHLSLPQGRGNVVLPSPIRVTLGRVPGVADEGGLQEEPLRRVQVRPLPQPEHGQTRDPHRVPVPQGLDDVPQVGEYLLAGNTGN